MPSPPPPQPRAAGVEFVALLAMMTSLVAFSIDGMLPALPAIARDLGIARENDRQLILTVLFLGMAVGQVGYGPVSDSIGRKPAIYGGLVIFIAGSLLCLLAGDLRVMLAGRFLEGIGAAGPRIVSMALVRDLYRGEAMARIVSLVTSVFILVPVVAPSIGQGIILVAHWRVIFAVFLAQALVGFVWFAWRQVETLPVERRAPFTLRRIASAFRETCRNRIAIGYTLSAGLVYGAFIGYLSSAQQIMQDEYGLGALFPIYFSALALSIGAASIVNARLVVRLGMRRLARTSLAVMSALSAGFLVVAFAAGGQPPLWSLMAYLLVTFFCLGILFGNFNALAMEPLGHIAGVAAAVVGSITTFLSLGLGTLLGQVYDGTVRPLAAGFAILALASAALMRFAERGRGHAAG